MRKPDNDFIHHFRKRFGDLLLSSEGETRQAGALVDGSDPMLPVSYANDHELVSTVQIDNANAELELGLVRDASHFLRLPAPELISPMVVAKKHKTSHNRNLPGSGAVFHNEAGDLHSPMIQWDTTASPFFDTSIQNAPPNFWVGSDCFTPLAQTQHWLHDNTQHEQLDDLPGFFTRDHFDYATANKQNDSIPIDEVNEQTDSKFDLNTSELDLSGDLPLENREEFRYNVTLQAPTAILPHTTGSPVTYLNKGQTYKLTVVDSKPPIQSDRLLEYRTYVRVSFEQEEQRSNPVGSWHLWEEGRGLKEAYKRNSELLAVEYVDPSTDSARYQGYSIVQVEHASVDGFCVTWRADPTTQVCQYTISLRFNFLSTDFSRSKGVKGVPVRLCAKTEIIRSDGENRISKHNSEMSYCVVKLFRDHGAERKLANDMTHVKKSIEKLNNEIANREQTADFDRSNAGYDSMNNSQFPQKRKSSIKSQKSHTAEKDLHAELAQMHALFFSARQMTIFKFRGHDRDDPDFYPVILSGGSNATTKCGSANIQQTGSTSITSAFENSDHDHPSQKPYMRSGQFEGSVSQHGPLELRTVSIRAVQDSFLSTMQSSKAVACFYIQFKHYGKELQSYLNAIYLVDRTALDFKEKLADKVKIDPTSITNIIWETSKGLKVVVDDNLIQHLPEAQIMTADIYDISQTNAASSGSNPSLVEIKLVF